MQPAWQGSRLRCGAPAARRKCFRRRMQRGSPAAITHLRCYAHIVLQRAQNEHRCRRPCYRLARAICRLLLAERDEKECVIASNAARVRQTSPGFAPRVAGGRRRQRQALGSKPCTASISLPITRYPFTMATWILCGTLGESILSTVHKKPRLLASGCAAAHPAQLQAPLVNADDGLSRPPISRTSWSRLHTHYNTRDSLGIEMRWWRHATSPDAISRWRNSRSQTSSWGPALPMPCAPHPANSRNALTARGPFGGRASDWPKHGQYEEVGRSVTAHRFRRRACIDPALGAGGAGSAVSLRGCLLPCLSTPQPLRL